MQQNDMSPVKTLKGRGSPTSKKNAPTLQFDPNSLLHSLSEKEVDIESYKTIIVAQDEKIKVLDSVRDDLAIARDHLQQSESARALLQEQLRANGERAREEEAKNKKYQETLIMENRRLQEELDKTKSEKGQLERDLGQKNLTIQMQTQKTLELTSTIERLTYELQRLQDVDRQKETASQIVAKLNEQKARLQKDLETASDYLLE